MPFTESGVCITLLLTRLPYGGGWLYAADLAGAALGCLGVIFVLLVIDPVSATLGIGALAAGAGWMVVRDSGDIRSLAPERRRRACAGRRGRRCTPDWIFPAKAIWASSGPRGLQQTGTLFERWNTYSRVQGDGAWRDRSVRLGLRPHRRR